MNARVDAVRGSAMLRDAIFRCMGVELPKEMRRPHRRTSRVWWTDAETDMLRKMARAGLNANALSGVLGRTPPAIRKRAWRMRIALGNRHVRHRPRTPDRSLWTDSDRLAVFAHVPDGLAEMVVAMCASQRLRLDELRGPKRDNELVKCRQEISLAARQMGYSYPLIARALNRDHTTVIYGVNRLRKQLSA
jgi:hypothetical protein